MRMMTATLAAALGFLAQDPPKTDIGWNLKSGQKVRYEIEKATLIHGTMGTVDMRMKLGLVLEAGERDADGKIPLKITIDRVAMSGKDDKSSEDYDTDKDKAEAKNPAIQIAAGCLNGHFEAKLSKQGAMSDIKGLKEVVEKSVQGVAEIKAMGDDKAAARFTESFDQLFQEGFNVAAGTALAKGSSWDSSPGTVVFGNGEAPLKIKSTVKEIRPGEAVIGRALEFDFSKDERNPDGKGSGTGEVIWSTERGFPISGQWQVHVTTARGNTETTYVLKLAPREKK